MASGNFAIILSLMQRVMGYPLTLQNFDFWRFFGHKRPIMSKKSRHVHDNNVTRGKKLPDFIMSSFLLSKTDICSKLFFRS